VVAVTVPEVGVGAMVGAIVGAVVGAVVTVGGLVVGVGAPGVAVGTFGVATIGGVKVLTGVPGPGVSAGTAAWTEVWEVADPPGVAPAMGTAISASAVTKSANPPVSARRQSCVRSSRR
jgi:hypothetical protein